MKQKRGSPAISVPPCVRLGEASVCEPAPLQRPLLHLGVRCPCICMHLFINKPLFFPRLSATGQIHISLLLKIEQDSWLQSRAACCGRFSCCLCINEVDAAKPFKDSGCLSQSDGNKAKRHWAAQVSGPSKIKQGKLNKYLISLIIIIIIIQELHHSSGAQLKVCTFSTLK